MYLQGLKGIDRNRAMPHYADQGTFFSLSSTKNGDNVDIDKYERARFLCLAFTSCKFLISEEKQKRVMKMDGGTSWAAEVVASALNCE